MSVGYLYKSIKITSVGKEDNKPREPFGDTRNTEYPSTRRAGLVFRRAAHEGITWPVTTLVTPVLTNVEIQFRLPVLYRRRGFGRETSGTFSFLRRLFH